LQKKTVKNLKVIGLTGGSGSGKGYICRLFEEVGIPSLDTDKVVHDLYSNDPMLLSELVKEFGYEILENGQVNRKVLGKIVFSDPDKLDTLNYIVHKYVLAECRKWLREKEREGYGAAIIDAPQLFESGFHNECDYVISVLASNEERIDRIINRDNISYNEALKRIQNQMSNEQYAERSDFVIYNNAADNPEIQIANILHKIFK